MKVVRLQDIPNVPMEGAEPIEGWTGPVSRSRQTIIQPGDSANYNCSVVNFRQGCKPFQWLGYLIAWPPSIKPVC